MTTRDLNNYHGISGIKALSEVIKSEKIEAGYLWYSNSPSIIPQKGDFDIQKALTSGSIPFVVEGFLISENGVSINIKNVEGEYHVTTAKIHKSPDDQFKKVMLQQPFDGFQFAEFMMIFSETGAFETAIISSFS